MPVVRSLHVFLSFLIATLLLTGTSVGQTTERVSVTSQGQQANGVSYSPSLSADGRLVAFYSTAKNLVSGDTNLVTDIFVHDRQSGITERVSVDSQGVQGNGYSYFPSLSADGRYVVFESASFNLVPGDTNGRWDIFVHDRQTGTTERVSVDSQGNEGNSDCFYSDISADGRYVAFSSYSTNLIPGDTNGAFDIFVHDRQTGNTERVSLSSQGVPGNETSTKPKISGDGRVVAFLSSASNLVAGDTNAVRDVFVHDRTTGLTERVNLSTQGVQANNGCSYHNLSADARTVSFDSTADNLVPGDTNGEDDVFVHDRVTDVTQRVSVDSFGAQGNDQSVVHNMSSDGRFVAFKTWATNLAPDDTNQYTDILVHEIQTGITTRVNRSSEGVEADHWSSRPALSADGSLIAFESRASTLVPADTNGAYDIFVRDRWNGLGTNSIHLAGPSSAPVGVPLDLAWYTAHASSDYWLAYSLNSNGSVVGGHSLDLGLPRTLLATGLNSVNGAGTYTSSPVPAAAAGRSVYFEVVARDGGGVLYDSNVLAVAFF